MSSLPHLNPCCLDIIARHDGEGQASCRPETVVAPPGRSPCARSGAHGAAHRSPLFYSIMRAVAVLFWTAVKILERRDFFSYSYLSATMGSTFIARRAGTHAASVATRNSKSMLKLSVTGLVGATP